MTRALSAAELVEIDRVLADRSLSQFVKMAWHVLEPANPYVHGWHIDAVCEHLAAITSGDITRLLINIPPGTMKSLMVNVIWPCWEWGPKGMASMRYVAASHAQDLSIRDNRKMRQLVESPWYQERWPTPFVSDQNSKIKFENRETGFRQACAIASMTGVRGDRVILDDPHTVEAALSDAHRETALRVFTETIPTRLNSPKDSAIIVVMQRLHEEDVSGHIIGNDLGYEHLMLPMEFEPERKCYTSIGFEDPRTEDGELLFPGRFPREVVERDKKAMGSLATAGQFQQRPAPRSGGFFEWDKLEVVDSLPSLGRMVRWWDKAGSTGKGDFTAGVLMAVSEDGKEFFILDVVHGQWAAPKRERIIRETAEKDGKGVEIWCEQEPGSGGKESAMSTIANLAPYLCRAECSTGDKATRAEPLSVQIEAGNVKLRYGGWNQLFIDEFKTFPRGKHDDQVDAAAAAFVKLAVDKPRQVRVAIVGGTGSSCPSFYSSANAYEPPPRVIMPFWQAKQTIEFQRSLHPEYWPREYKREANRMCYSTEFPKEFLEELPSGYIDEVLDSLLPAPSSDEWATILPETIAAGVKAEFPGDISDKFFLRLQDRTMEKLPEDSFTALIDKLLAEYL